MFFKYNFIYFYIGFYILNGKYFIGYIRFFGEYYCLERVLFSVFYIVYSIFFRMGKEIKGRIIICDIFIIYLIV